MYSKSIQTIKTSLRPVIAQDTRWGSTYLMLLKYLKLFPFLPQCAFCDATKEVFLTNDEDKDIRLLCDQLKEVEIRLKFLQGDYCDVDEWDSDAETKKDKAVAREAKKPKRSPLTLLSSRIVFDQLIDLFPSMKSHLAADAHVVHNRDFENAVIKIQKACVLKKPTISASTELSPFSAVSSSKQPDHLPTSE